MNARQALGLAGSVVLFIGVFAPLVTVPIMGSMNFYQNGEGDGMIIIALAAGSLIMALTQRYKVLWFTGGASLAIVLYALIRFQAKISEVKADMEMELADNPFRGLAEMAISQVQIQWGWALLAAGAVLIVISAALKSAGGNQNRQENDAEA